MISKHFFLLYIIFFTCTVASAQADSSRFIYLHIIHGSKPKAPGEYKSIGGFYGGHTVIQVDTFLYGFNYRSRKIHLFPSKRNNSGIFEKVNYSEWISDKKKYKITSITIPVSHQQYEQLKTQYEEYVSSPPHDYAFFGMRCASSCYYMLGRIGVVEQCSMTQSTLKAFHPKMLRKRMLKQAERLNYAIKVQKGSYNRRWEGD